jgi:hypothetical protein
MNNEKTTVITAYGHDKTIDKISVSLFDKAAHDYYDKNARTYCNTINSLKLEGDLWVFAKIVSENTLYPLDSFLFLDFDMLATLDDRTIQEILRKVDSQDFAMALKIKNEAVQEKIFRNMSKRAAQMLKEDMEFMGPVRLDDVEKARDKILDIILQLEQTGEIAILKGEMAK